MPKARVLWLTGAPGVGKTTVIRRVAEALPHLRLGGFYTEEIREGGVRRGFRLQSFRGDSAVIAHVDWPKHDRVGRYGVDVAAIDRLARDALSVEHLPDVYLVDEVGKMECLSPDFVASVRQLLERPITIGGTIARTGHGAIAAFKQWPGSVLREVTRENRDSLPARVMKWVEQSRR